MAEKAPLFNPAHYLMGCRLDNWLRLLWENKFAIDPARLPQAALLGGMSLALSPFAAAESLLYDRKVNRVTIDKDPLYILGFWRMGTTYLQNILAHDPQFAWADPVGTASVAYSKTLHGLFTYGQARVLGSARPMDNLKYSLELPLEETFGVATLTPYSIIHMIAFPTNYRHYIPGAFIGDLSSSDRRAWEKAYLHLLKKLTWAQGGKRLMLKSPDNTAHVPQLLKLFPDARFLNIHRDPYTTILSTMHMFRKQMDFLRLSKMPPNFDQTLEDTLFSIFERMYHKLFREIPAIAPNRFYEIGYEEFVEDPIAHLRRAYDALELDGFEEALPQLQAYVDSQKSYSKNRFELDDRLKAKIEERLGFYFDHYGYARR